MRDRYVLSYWRKVSIDTVRFSFGLNSRDHAVHYGRVLHALGWIIELTDWGESPHYTVTDITAEVLA